jgi:hypothetical protein
MMRHPLALLPRRLRGADVEAAVDLESVGVDDLSAQAPAASSIASELLPEAVGPTMAKDSGHLNG